MDISIIIINHNTKMLTLNCIKSIKSTIKKYRYEIILIDNSTDKSQRIHYPNNNIKIIYTKNEGFSKACNIGAVNSKGRYILLLNSDTVVHNNCIDLSLKYLDDNPEYSALGCRILLPDGTLDKGCKRGFPTPFASICYMLHLDKKFPQSKTIGRYHTTYKNELTTDKIEVISGAFFLIRKKVYNMLHGLDEKYFMYGEDIDLCYKIYQNNLQIVYYPQAEITHYKGSSGLNKKSDFIIKQFYKSMIIFYDNNFKEKYSKLTEAIIKIAVYTKMTVSRIIAYFSRKVANDRNTSSNT